MLKPGEPKIENLGAAPYAEANVFRIEVAVNNASGMRGGEAVGNRGCDLDRGAPGHLRTHDSLPHGFSFEKLSYEEYRRVLQFGIVDGDDIWMGQGRDALGFFLETRQGDGIQ